MKSRVSILTLVGRSFLALNASAVTIGYLSNSSDLSWGNISVLCCQLLSREETSPGAFLIDTPREYFNGCLSRWFDSGHRYLILEQVSWENNRRNTRERIGLSIIMEASSCLRATLERRPEMAQAFRGFNAKSGDHPRVWIC